MLYVKIIALLPALIFIYQLFSYAVSRQTEDRQGTCFGMGIVYSSIGITCLVFHDIFFVFLGLVLFMFGLILLSKSLDRRDKKIFIDRYQEDTGEKDG